jgi:hypothetical protein
MGGSCSKTDEVKGLKDLGKILLKWALEKYDVRFWTVSADSK